jgi:2-dehydropantoate 2-reductase
MNILIVGAGAVGLVYGHHFANAGHQVTFLVKEKYQQALEAEKKKGVVLYHLNNDKHLQQPLRFTRFSTITEWQDAEGFDLIALSISSTALRQLPLSIINNKIKESINSVSLLMLQPSEEDLEHLTAVIDDEHILQGMITLISYQTDHINERINPTGTAYYLPPLPMPISACERLRQQEQDSFKLKEVVTLFNQSGIKAKAVNSALDESRLISAFFMTFLCALEAADWQFERLKNSEKLLQQLSAAQKELLPQKIIANGVFTPLKKRLLTALLKPWLYKMLIKISPRVIPLPLEAYLKKHFLKVRPQTLMYLQDYQNAFPSEAVAELVSLITEKSPKQAY